MADYSRHYAVLGTTHSTDWEALRARYKRLIGQWHPDRFPADTTEKELAEEYSKQITIAYRTIESYYRDHGVLPPLEPATIDEKATGTATRSVVAEPNNANPVAEPQTAAATEHPPTAAPRRRRTLIVLSALALGAYVVFHHADDQTSDGDTATPAADTPQVPATAPKPRETSQESGGITVGSTLGEVYSIQGIPTLTQGDTWYYGKSSVRFEQGKVVSWTQHPDNPLRIARDQPLELREGLFYIGSTKEEVRSIQGTPVSETETVWDYGPSRVFFEHNRVVRWEASPLQPLRVPH